MSLRAAGLALLGLSMSLAQGPEAIGQMLEQTTEPAPAPAMVEISYLLSAMGASGCTFYRNGSWYDSKTAEAHLQDKYARLLAFDRIKTAEDFIDQAATRSSLSGEAYAVRCGQETSVSSSSWLHGLLSRYREAAKSGAPRDKRDAPGKRPFS